MRVCVHWIFLIFVGTGSRSKRHTTLKKTEEHQQRAKEREIKEKEKMMKDIAARKNMAAVRRLTQEELLEEAKRTEVINLRSLGTLI